MSLQKLLNQDCIDRLPQIKSIMKKVGYFERNQIEYKTIQWALESDKPVKNMNEDEVYMFECKLMDLFKERNWI